MTRGNPEEEEDDDSDTDDIDHSGEERACVDSEQTQNAAQFVKP